MKLMFVHKYKWSHEARRKKLRRALKENKIILLQRTKDGFLYEVPKDFKL